MRTPILTLMILLPALQASPCDEPTIPDADGDGYDETVDCDDFNAGTYPGGNEICDGMDNNCDGVADEGFDADADGYLSAQLCPGAGQDCNDADAAINPSATEVCDAADHDCDGAFDEACGAELTWTTRRTSLSAVVDADQGSPISQSFTQSQIVDTEENVFVMDAPWSGLSLEASALEVSSFHARGMSASGDTYVQLQDAAGGGGGYGYAQGQLVATFKVSLPTPVRMSAHVDTDIYDYADSVTVGAALGTNLGPVLELSLSDTVDQRDGSLSTLLQPGTYQVIAQSQSEASLSGSGDDYPGATAVWQLRLEIDSSVLKEQ